MTWDEFSTYMMTMTLTADDKMMFLDESKPKIFPTNHREIIVYIDYIQKDKKYLTIRFNSCLY